MSHFGNPLIILFAPSVLISPLLPLLPPSLNRTGIHPVSTRIPRDLDMIFFWNPFHQLFFISLLVTLATTTFDCHVLPCSAARALPSRLIHHVIGLDLVAHALYPPHRRARTCTISFY
jgi:hypothetical protein